MTATLPPALHRQFWQRPLFWILVVVGFAGVGAVWAGVRSFQQGERQAFRYLEEAVTVERRDVERTVTASGTIVADQVTILASDQPATVTEVLRDPGDLVSTDDVVVKLEVELPTRTETREITAPFDGRILAVNTFTGDRVSAFEPLVQVGYRTTHIEFFASEAEVIDLTAGLPATLRVPSFDGGRQEFAGEVTFVDLQKSAAAASSAGQPAEVGYRVRVSTGSLPEELARTLGLTIDVEIVVDRREDVPALVKGAIQYDENDQPFVYRVPNIDQQFIARAKQTEEITTLLDRQPVTLGFEGDEYIEIASGIREGETVLLYVPAATAESIF